jgi:hypothetical protein
MLGRLKETKQVVTDGLLNGGHLAELRLTLLRVRDLLAGVISEVVEEPTDWAVEIKVDDSLLPDPRSLYLYSLNGRMGTSKIMAIKHIRERMGWGLKDCKDYIDNLQAKARMVQGGPF